MPPPFAARTRSCPGPAGGIVGMARTAAEAGFGQVIGFDMGGTSTDVSHFAGAYERTSERTVAGRPGARADAGNPHRRGRRRLDLRL